MSIKYLNNHTNWIFFHCYCQELSCCSYSFPKAFSHSPIPHKLSCPLYYYRLCDVLKQRNIGQLDTSTVCIIKNKRQTLYGQLILIPSKVSHSRSVRLSCNTSVGDETIITHCATLSVLVVSLIILLPLWGSNLGSFILDSRL